MKIGFFGGSFNPPTNAHIDLAKTAIEACKLDKLIFVPMGDLYNKKNLAKAKDRYSMLEIACRGIKNIEVSDLEIKVNKELHTIDAFRLIEDAYKNNDNWFLMGADNFIKLLNWKESENLSKYNYIVFERGDVNLKEYIKNNEMLKNTKVQIIENNKYKYKSATEFRNLLKGDIKEQNIVPNEVLEFIKTNHIYQREQDEENNKEDNK
ncbi:MAG: nicotinate (nicotinamide) nucleotide adenylyltransferase [Clostridia bacterium]|nr:nicotinate (nicotinamide) nucleotide adenylyltransferase [Clostridia bacterium]